MMVFGSLGYVSREAGSADALLTAAYWIQGLLMGSIASVIAIIAIAVVGLMMLNGRIDIRRGITAVLGCFLLFGAPVIAAGLQGAVTTNPDQPAPYVPPAISTEPSPAVTTPTRSPAPYDPYAGASVPSGN